MKYLLLILPFILVLATGAFAQQSSGGKLVTEIIASSSSAVVKGAPFAAEAVSESVQMLADGNKISRSFTTKMFRDSEGRFRREGGSGGNGAATYGSSITTAYFSDAISIFDPVANVRYILNPTERTARKMNMVSGVAESAVILSGQALSPTAKIYIEQDAAKRAEATAALKAATIDKAVAAERANVIVLPSLITGQNAGAGKTESLGIRNIEGVDAEGTRTITTIPAGTVGNERDIEIVYERWYSKELQLIVYSRHYDPRFGEQIYRLVNINRNEPDRSLFVPPPDYNIVSEQTHNKITVNRTYNAAKPKQEEK